MIPGHDTGNEGHIRAAQRKVAGSGSSGKCLIAGSVLAYRIHTFGKLEAIDE